MHNNDDVVTNEQGGSQSRLDFDFTQLDANMLMRVARVLDIGAKKYGEKNWQKIPTHDHINHMIYHAIMANTNDTTEDHLANTICRAMFAMWTQQNDLARREVDASLAELIVSRVEDPSTPPENICTCGHHVIAHHSIGTYKHPARGSCRSIKCGCLKFDPSTSSVVGQGTE